MGAFFPFPGPFSPLLPMSSLFFSHVGVTGMQREWPRFVGSYHFFCFVSMMLFVWYAEHCCTYLLFAVTYYRCLHIYV
jgi:hypothetical protein